MDDVARSARGRSGCRCTSGCSRRWASRPATGCTRALYAEFTDLANYALFDDVRATLDAADGGRVLSSASCRTSRSGSSGCSRSSGVLEVFDVTVICGIEGMEKPDPRIFRLALERAGIEPGEAVYVGDSPEFDIDPPAALGMFPVLIDRRDRFPTMPARGSPACADLVDGARG